MKTYQIAIDGPASSGKSTVAKILAKQLGYTYIDTGAMYRAVAYYILENNIDPNDDQTIKNHLTNIKIEFKNTQTKQLVFLNDSDVTKEIRQKNVASIVSQVAAKDYIRDYLVDQQRLTAKNISVVMDGRDIGSVVLPDADVKFFLNASVEERARRRWEENQAKGLSSESLEEIKEAIQARDYYDSQRQHSPLVKTSDMIEIDTSDLSIDQVNKKMYDIIKDKINTNK